MSRFFVGTKNRQSLQKNLSASCVFPIDDSARVQSLFSMLALAT